MLDDAHRSNRLPAAPGVGYKPQHFARAIHPHDIPAPGPGGPDIECVQGGGFQPVHLRLRPGDDKRATKARFHCLYTLPLVFLLSKD